MSSTREVSTAEIAAPHVGDLGEPAGTGREPSRPGRRRLIAIAIAAMVVLSAIAYGAARPSSSATAGPAIELSTSSPIGARALLHRYGVRVTMVAVTAGGGIVDMRVEVVDAKKALAILHGTGTQHDTPDVADTQPMLQPVVVDEGTGLAARVAGEMAHAFQLKDGRSYYVLLSNTGGVIQPGASVSVVLGHVRLEHVIAVS